MKLVESSVELLKQEPGMTGINKMIELAGRTCYKSEDKITEDSAEAFVQRMINSHHTAMLEHGTVYLKLPPVIDEKTTLSHSFDYDKNPYSKIVFNGYDADYVTTNLRVLQENGWLNDLKYLCEPTEFHEKRITLKFITSIGITRELVRHRAFSFANESTRYCNYGKDRFNNELTFIVPSWSSLPCGTILLLPKNDKDAVWCVKQEHIDSPVVIPDITGNLSLLEIMGASEREYKTMIKEGFTAQQVREVLPICTKSEIVMTGFVSDWKHFFDLRLLGTTGKPHPDMLFLAEKAKNMLEKNKLWDYIMSFPSKFN